MSAYSHKRTFGAPHPAGSGYGPKTVMWCATASAKKRKIQAFGRPGNQTRQPPIVLASPTTVKSETRGLGIASLRLSGGPNRFRPRGRREV